MNWTGTILTFASFFWMSVKVNNAENNDEAAKPFLLPKNLWPDSYNVVITVNLEESDFSFNGSSEITVSESLNTMGITYQVSPDEAV